ncbi:unnamed protein product, partial [Sphagnum jensenii]
TTSSQDQSLYPDEYGLYPEEYEDYLYEPDYDINEANQDQAEQSVKAEITRLDESEVILGDFKLKGKLSEAQELEFERI